MKHNITINQDYFSFVFVTVSTKSRDIINQLFVTHNLPFKVRFLRHSITMYEENGYMIDINDQRVTIDRKKICGKYNISLA